MLGSRVVTDGGDERVTVDNMNRDLSVGGEGEPALAVTEVWPARGASVVKDDGRHADVLTALGATTRMAKPVEDARRRLKEEEDFDCFSVVVDGKLRVCAKAREARRSGHVAHCSSSAVPADSGRDFAEEDAAMGRAVKKDTTR